MRQQIQIHSLRCALCSCHRKGQFPLTKMVFCVAYKCPSSPNTIRWPTTILQVMQQPFYRFSIRPSVCMCAYSCYMNDEPKCCFVLMSIIHTIRAIPIVFVMIQTISLWIVSYVVAFTGLNNWSFINNLKTDISIVCERREWKQNSICLHIVGYFLLNWRKKITLRWLGEKTEMMLSPRQQHQQKALRFDIKDVFNWIFCLSFPLRSFNQRAFEL